MNELFAWLLPHSLPEEHPPGPLAGYKLGYPMLSADGSAVGFAGVSLGWRHVYGSVADATCVMHGRHTCPHRRCDCGFYCFDSPGAARALRCSPQYRSAALLDVEVSGRFIRYEKGLRYSRQRVRAVHIGACRCGRSAQCLVDTADGQPGWRRLAGSCAGCAGRAPAMSLRAYAALAGEGVTVCAEQPVEGWWPPYSVETAPQAENNPEQLAVLSAEVALLQARLDDLQGRLERLS